MVAYDFYINSYLGSVIPEKAFSGMAARAEAVLERFKRIYRVESTGETSEKMAVCAMAEVLYENAGRRGVSSASVGSVSVSYRSDSADKSLTRELYDSACVYLTIRRGVK